MQENQGATKIVSIKKPSFITTIFDPEDLVEIRKINESWTKPKLEWHKCKDLKPAMVSLLMENKERTNIYFGVNPRREKGARDSSGVVTPRVLCADIDFHETDTPDEGKFRETLSASNLPHPTIITCSGHGYQMFWKVMSMSIPEWLEAQKAVISAFNGEHNKPGPADRTIKDLPRVMRMPGFKNWRNPNKPVMATVMEINPDNVYPISTFLTVTTITAVDRARKYLEGIPGAVSGQNGDNHTFTTACRLVNDFSLSPEEGWPLFLEWNQRCSPPWSDKDLREKLNNAMKYHTAAPGKLLGESSTRTKTEGKTFQDGGKERRAPKVNLDKLTELMRDCTLLSGTTMIWDDKEKKILNPEQVRVNYLEEGKMWLKSPDKRKIRQADLVFNPAGCEPGQINRFQGFKVSPIEGPHDLIENHILTLCSGDVELAKWLTSWMAYPLQHPGTKMQTAVIIHGAQGTGKNLLFDPYLKIFEPYSSTLNQSVLEGRFTDWIIDKCFVLADEVVANQHQGLIQNRLKSMVTGGVMRMEGKGIASEDAKNFANFVFLSNKNMPLILDADDRRFVVIRCDIVHGPEYYCNLANQINPGVLLHFLKNYDCQDFYAHTKPIVTEAKMDLIDVCRSGCQRFVNAWKAGNIPPFEFRSISASSLYNIYKYWCEACGEKQYMVSANKFGKECSQSLERQHSRLGAVYVGTVDGMVAQETIDQYRITVMREKI